MTASPLRLLTLLPSRPCWLMPIRPRQPSISSPPSPAPSRGLNSGARIN